MKYSINHYGNFTTPYPAFFLAFLHFFVNIAVEVNVIIILTSIQDVLETLMKYVALAVASNIPKFYFNSLLSDNKMTKVNQKSILITKRRTEHQPLKDANWSILFLRFVYKSVRILFCSFSYYFMPFMAIVLNMKYMV
jgi:hypothetical protein